jgi:hypothetical protein
MLTPEIMAAQKAGSLIETTFYSDAKAATVLKTAISGLITEFEILQSKASTGAISVAPALSTMAGNLVQPGGGGRVVNPTHPLISPEDTRSMSHLNPVARMTPDEKAAQTIFGVVPGAPKVNQKIGNNPQMYMSGDLPKIEGLTSIGGASTGIVAEEAAKWHAMTGALAMQSQTEIAALKKEVGMTGLITAELSDSYQALLPTMTKLTANAATESAAIVAQLQAGKITVDQARAKIIQLNAQVESMIAQASVDIAGQQGRSIGLTTVPLLNQPVVNAAGKTNMKELTRPGRTRDLLNKIARGLGVKTFGAGYSTETTMPKRFNTGNLVPGTGNTDTVPAMLTPGEFVVNAKATRENLPLLQAINGKGSGGPGYEFGSAKEIQAQYSGRELAHLTEMLYTKDLKADQHAALMREFGVSYDDVKSNTGRVGSSLTAAYHSFFNQGTNNGNLDIQKAIDYLEGKPVMDPRFGMVTHDPKLAYKAMMMDLGVAGEDMDNFGKDLDRQILATLKSAQSSGVEYVADTPKSDKQVGTASIGNAVEDYVSASGNPEMKKALKALKKPGEFRVQRQGKSSSDRYFPKATSKVSTMLASIVAKKRMPQKLPNLLNIFPKTGKVFQLPKKDIVAEGMASRMSYNRKLYKKNQGGIIGMNAGGMVPGVQYLNEGSDSPVKPITFGSAYSQQREKGFVGKSMFGGQMAGMGVGMGMQMAGGMMGGQAGTALQFASVLPMMAPNLLSGIPKMLGNIAGGLKGVGGAAGLAGKAMGMFANAGPLLALTAAITVGYLAFKKFKEEQEQNRIEQSNSIGITEKSAAEAGIKYNNLSDSIKSVNDQLDLARAKGRNAYESLNSSGVQGLTLSIQELKKNIKDAKENQKELVSTFSNIDVSGDANKQAKVVEIATNLKAQFVAAGMSAQDATNKIYSIISASDKAGMAFNAISSKGFREILDSTTAADAMITKLGKNMNSLSAEDLGNSISNAAAALDVNLNKLMKTKGVNGELMTQQEAMSQILDDINAKEGSKTTITQLQIDALKKTQPELAAILNTTDNVASMYSKWRLLLAGVRTDLKNISSEQAQALVAFESALDTAISQSETKSSGSGIAARSQKSILALQKLIAAGGQKAAVNAQKTQDQIKEEIKLIDKKIDKINEEAEARKKALDAAQSKENLALEIQKAQLEYADKMAAGDMAGAAQAQLKIKQLVGERETQKAIDAIEENRAKREKELIAKREKLQAQSDQTSKNLTNAQNNSTSAAERMNKVDQYQNEYERLIKEQTRVNLILKNDPTNKKALKDQQDLVRGPLGDLAKQISADTKGSDKVLSAELKKIFTGTLIDKDGKSLAGGMTRDYQTGGSQLSAPYYKPGEADKNLALDSKAALDGAKAITGGKTLADVYTAVLTGQGKGRVLDVNKIASASYGGRTWDDIYKGNKQINKASIMNTVSNKVMYEKLIKENGLQKGDSFILNGVKYNVKGASSIVRDASYIQKASGGYISGPGTGTSDSIPAMLSNGEFVINAKSASSFGYGNLEQINKMAAGGLATKFDIPSYSTGGRIKYGDGGEASRRSNVTINATLNFAEAPKNGRELWKEFKEIAKSEGAKVGESVLMGRMNS